MVQEIQVLASIKIDSNININFSDWNRYDLISEKDNGESRTLLVLLYGEINAYYSASKIKKIVTSKLLTSYLMNINAVDIIKLREEAEIYGNV